MTDIINLDDSVENADWLKTTWDLPPYKSPEFFAVVPFENLDAFRALPVYQAAVASGLIHDDEWVADYVSDPSDRLADNLLDAIAAAAAAEK